MHLISMSIVSELYINIFKQGVKQTRKCGLSYIHAHYVTYLFAMQGPSRASTAIWSLGVDVSTMNKSLDLENVLATYKNVGFNRQVT